MKTWVRKQYLEGVYYDGTNAAEVEAFFNIKLIPHPNKPNCVLKEQQSSLTGQTYYEEMPFNVYFVRDPNKPHGCSIWSQKNMTDNEYEEVPYEEPKKDEKLIEAENTLDRYL